MNMKCPRCKGTGTVETELKIYLGGDREHMVKTDNIPLVPSHGLSDCEESELAAAAFADWMFRNASCIYMNKFIRTYEELKGI